MDHFLSPHAAEAISAPFAPLVGVLSGGMRGVSFVAPRLSFQLVGGLGSGFIPATNANTTRRAAVFRPPILDDAAGAFQTFPAALVLAYAERRAFRWPHGWGRRGLGTGNLWSNLIPPGPIRSFSNLELDQLDGFYLGPQFQAGANGMRIHLVILVDCKDPGSGDVGW